MSTIVRAVVTNGAQQYWPQFFGTLLGISSGTSTAGNWNPLIRFFRIGRGGWQATASSPIRRLPDPALTDLDCVVNSGNYTSLAGNLYYFQKNLSGGNFVFVQPNIIQVTCTLAAGEFNDIQGSVPTVPPNGASLGAAGTNPDLYEIGLYCDHPTPGNSGVDGVANGTAFTSASATFTAADAGRLLTITGSGAGNNGTYTIRSVTDAHTLVVYASFTNEASVHYSIQTNLMVAYGTFDKQTKTGGGSLTNIVRIAFGGP